jgi:hypothetical protein
VNDDQQPTVAEITREAHARCLAIGGGALEAVETLRAELEKNPALGRRAVRAHHRQSRPGTGSFGWTIANPRQAANVIGTVPDIRAQGVRLRPEDHVGVRLSGGIGPLRVSVSPGRAVSGFSGLSIAVIATMFKLMWWMLYAGYWMLRIVYWEAPRAGYRWWHRRQAEGAVSGGT